MEDNNPIINTENIEISFNVSESIKQGVKDMCYSDLEDFNVGEQIEADIIEEINVKYPTTIDSFIDDDDITISEALGNKLAEMCDVSDWYELTLLTLADVVSEDSWIDDNRVKEDFKLSYITEGEVRIKGKRETRLENGNYEYLTYSLDLA